MSISRHAAFVSLAFASLALAPAIAGAAASQKTSSISYDYVEGSFGELDEADAIYLGGAMGIDKQFAVVGSLGIIDADFVEATVLRGGALFHIPVEKNFDVFGALELAWTDYETPSTTIVMPPFAPVTVPGGGDNDIGFIATGGARFKVQDNLELEGKLTMMEVDPFDDGIGITVGGRFFIDKQLSFAGGFASDAEFDGLWINLRYNLK